MNTYFKALVANGTKHEHAAVLVQLDELARFDNREHPSYGRLETETEETE